MSIKVEDLMTKELITLRADDDLPKADELMRLNRLRHLPVVDGKRLAGLITHRDLLRLQTELLARLGSTADGDEEVFIPLTARDLMNEDVATTSSDTPAVDAAKRLLDSATDVCRSSTTTSSSASLRRAISSSGRSASSRADLR